MEIAPPAAAIINTLVKDAINEYLRSHKLRRILDAINEELVLVLFYAWILQASLSQINRAPFYAELNSCIEDSLVPDHRS